METPRKFIITELSIRKLGSSSVIILIMHYYFNLIFTMQTYKGLMILFFCVFECIFPVVLQKSFLVLACMVLV